jgi:DNA-binding MarR family transcriptional regulator
VTSEDVSTIDVGQAFLDLYHRVHRMVDTAMGEAGLSLARAKTLTRLVDGGPMNQSTLAGLLGFAPRSVTDTVDALERDGMVTRTEDQHDRRARIVAVTPAGREAYDAAQIVRHKIMDEIFGGLSAPERARFVALLTTIRSTLPAGDTHCVQ